MSKRYVEYQPPDWARGLSYIPTHMVKLAMTPTPIYEWKPPGTPEDFTVYIKRDDLTGSILTGNKVRKLEFIFAEALQRSCKHVITTGSLVSNHCRATAAASVELGLKPHLFLRTDAKDASEMKIDGNMLVSKLVGANMYLVPWFAKFETEVKPKMEKLAEKIEKETGEKSMVVPVGGTDIIGLWAYLQCFEEIKQQGIEFDDIVCVCSTGGTLTGLAIANYLNGSPYKVHGMRINGAYDIPKLLNEKIEELGLSGVTGEELVMVHEYVGLGYAVSQPQELEFISDTAVQTGIILDNTYTGKAAYGMIDMMKNKPEVFKGRRLLFLHTGGSIALHSAALSNLLLPYSKQSQIRMADTL